MTSLDTIQALRRHAEEASAQAADLATLAPSLAADYWIKAAALRSEADRLERRLAKQTAPTERIERT